MADTKISELPVATIIASPDVAPVVRAGVTMQADVSLFGGSFLSNETARVDPIYGDDSTGIIGDLDKPFASTQAAIDAFELISPLPSNPIIEIGGNAVDGFTTILPYITVIGQNGLETQGSQTTASAIISAITMSASDGPESNYVVLILKHCWMNGGIAFDGGAPNNEVDLINSVIVGGSIFGNASGALDVRSGSGFNRTISRVNNVSIQGGIGPSINLYDVFVEGRVSSIDGSTEVSLTRAVVNDIAATITFVTLTDSFITGTNSAGTTAFQNNVLFNPANWDFSTLPTSEPTETGKAWIDTTGGLNIVKVHL